MPNLNPTPWKRRCHGGKKNDPEYRVWQAMKYRCLNPNDHAYKDYGGRGIKVCEEWRRSYPAFIAHVGKRPSGDYHIDRIDNNGNYEPGNVRWATRSQQQRNIRTNLYIEHEGRRRLLIEVCEELGLEYSFIYQRYHTQGYRGDMLFKTPKFKARRKPRGLFE